MEKRLNVRIAEEKYAVYQEAARMLGTDLSSLVKTAVEHYIEHELDRKKERLRLEVTQMRTELEMKERLLKSQE